MQGHDMFCHQRVPWHAITHSEQRTAHGSPLGGGQVDSADNAQVSRVLNNQRPDVRFHGTVHVPHFLR